MKRRSFVIAGLSTLSFAYRTIVPAAESEIAAKTPGKSGYFSDPIFLQHHIDPRHPETPDRIRYIEKALAASGLTPYLSSPDFDLDPGQWLELVHSKQHIRSIAQNFPLAHKVAKAGVASCISAVDKVSTGQLDNAFCASRPPGHHALNTGKEEGFCYYNNVAVAARYAQQSHGLRKILIIDWDYHHGNATEAMFYEDPDILYFSTHDQFAYPGTGDPARKGAGGGHGYNINVHLPCGTGDSKMLEVFNTILRPAADKFAPELVLISAGFDGREQDLLGCFNISDLGYSAMTNIVMQIASQHCDGRLVSVLEGGYMLQGLGSAVVAHLRSLVNHQLN